MYGCPVSTDKKFTPSAMRVTARDGVAHDPIVVANSLGYAIGRPAAGRLKRCGSS